MRILVVSTPVGPLGSGVGGGVELTLAGLVRGLLALGHAVDVVAPAGSLLSASPSAALTLIEVDGALQPSIQHIGRDAPVSMPPDPVLAAMWDAVLDHQDAVDVVLNLAYDWLPLLLGPYLRVPVAHLVSMASMSDAMDHAIDRAVARRPGSLAVHGRAQAATFAHLASIGPDGAGLRVLGNGIDPDHYRFRADPDRPEYLGAVGRIAPEKGLEHVAALAERTGIPVRVWGLMQDPSYWDRIRMQHPGALLDYRGFLPTEQFQEAIGGCLAVVMTPNWVEAFGNVAVEAMACGVPVIAFDRGGPAEIVTDGVTGLIVTPDDVDELVDAVGRIDRIDRTECRRRVEAEYSLAAMARRVEAWLAEVVAAPVPTPGAPEGRAR